MDHTIEFKNELTDFINEKNIVGICAGVTIAYISKDVILSFVADVLIPIFILGILKLRLPLKGIFMPDKTAHMLNVTKFMGSAITWILGIIITYFFIKFAFAQLLGVSLLKKKEMETGKAKESEKSMDKDVSVMASGIDGFTMMFNR